MEFITRPAVGTGRGAWRWWDEWVALEQTLDNGKAILTTARIARSLQWGVRQSRRPYRVRMRKVADGQYAVWAELRETAQ